MTKPGRMTRRHALSVVAAALGSSFGLTLFPSPRKPVAAEALLGFLDPAGADAIGRACLAAIPPSQRSREWLRGAICADISLHAEMPAPPDLARRLHDRVRRDFAEGNMVAVDGWHLSLTEARLYALAAMG